MRLSYESVVLFYISCFSGSIDVILESHSRTGLKTSIDAKGQVVFKILLWFFGIPFKLAFRTRPSSQVLYLFIF